MGKFNIDAIRKRSSERGNESSVYGEQNRTIEVGGNLIKKGTVEMVPIHLKHDEIDPSPKNKRSMNEKTIEDLAEMIKDVGLLNPLIVREKEDGRYQLVAGERRWRAIGKLIQSGEWNPEKEIRAHLFDPAKIELNLPDEKKEDYVRVAENAGQRGKTDGDVLQDMMELKSIYQDLREKGEISGVKTRTLLAEDLQISESKVAQFQKVENQGSEALIQAILDNKVTVSTGTAIADLSKEEQEEFIADTLGKKQEEETTTIGKDDLRAWNHQKENPAEPLEPAETREEDNGDAISAVPASEGYKGKPITADRFKKDIRTIQKKLRVSVTYLDDEEYAAYLRYIEKLKSLLS